MGELNSIPMLHPNCFGQVVQYEIRNTTVLVMDFWKEGKIEIQMKQTTKT